MTTPESVIVRDEIVPPGAPWSGVVPSGVVLRIVDLEGCSQAGDDLDLSAEMDALAVLSNCPQTNNPCNGGGPSPIRGIVWKTREREDREAGKAP